MTEIKISMTMDTDYNVKLLNDSINKELKIDYTNKMINASDVYDLLSYAPDNNYMLESNIDSIPDGNEKDYFNELIQLITSITTELNNINSSDDETIESNNDKENTNEENEELDVENNDSINFDDFLS